MKPFKVFLILHSHIDIGYTERQEKMAVYQADFIRQAVDFALSSSQSARDPRSQFKFTAEGFWAVEQYRKRYGEEGRKRLTEAVKSGYFELTGGYFHIDVYKRQDQRDCHIKQADARNVFQKA